MLRQPGRPGRNPCRLSGGVQRRDRKRVAVHRNRPRTPNNAGHASLPPDGVGSGRAVLLETTRAMWPLPLRLDSTAYCILIEV